MKSMCLTLCAIILFALAVIARQDNLNPNIRNESKIEILSKDAAVKRWDYDGATRCGGTVDDRQDELHKIGITKEDLSDEVYCTVGDFDGNGYLDFAIWGGDIKNNDYPDYEYYLVLFFEKDKVIHSIPIKSESPGSLFLHYPPRAEIGPNGEPVSKNDALWLVGDTDGYDDESKGIVFIYDLNTEGFKKIPFGGE